MDKDKFSKKVITEVGKAVYLEIWNLTKSIIFVLILISLGLGVVYLINIMT